MTKDDIKISGERKTDGVYRVQMWDETARKAAQTRGELFSPQTVRIHAQSVKDALEAVRRDYAQFWQGSTPPAPENLKLYALDMTEDERP